MPLYQRNHHKMDQYFDVLKKYAVFEGRAGRREYWMFVLFSFIVSIVVAIIGSVLGAIVHLSIFGTDHQLGIQLGRARYHPWPWECAGSMIQAVKDGGC